MSHSDSVSWLFQVVVTAITSFIATNIDDILVLLLFFSSVNKNFRIRDIVVGQYLGFTLLILASLPGLLGGIMLPTEWIRLLGLFPIIIGVKQLLTKEESSEDIQLVAYSVHTYQVAAVTVANGGDNIAIYIPLFAKGGIEGFFITVMVFYLMVGVWCALAYFLGSHPFVSKILTTYGHRMVPFVLISLGIYIFIS